MNTVWKGTGCKIVEGYIRRVHGTNNRVGKHFGRNRVDARGVLTLVEKTPRLVIIDSHIAMDRNQGHLEGSLSLPDMETNCAALARIIPEQDRPALFYCNDIKCGRSSVAVKIARQCGYTRLYWYRGRFEDWEQKNYPCLKK
jgi:rhodanese-related sulfurtransferase